MPKCKIVFDTNILRQSDFAKVASTLEFVRAYLKDDVAELAITEISEKEWKKFKADVVKKAEKSATSALKKLKEYGYREIEIEKMDIDQTVADLFKQKRDDIKFSIIPIPTIDQTELVERAIQKKIPFTQGEGDDGFKDTLLFYSLKQDARGTGIKLYILVTEDHGFDGAEQEFQNDTGAELCISRESTLIDLLDEKLSIGLKLAEKRKEIEAIIEENKNEFEIHVLKSEKSNFFPRSGFIEGYTFKDFTMQEFWPNGEGIYRVNGVISANIIYNRPVIQPMSDASVVGISGYEVGEALQSTAVSSVLGSASIGPVYTYSPWHKTQENFYASLVVNTRTKKVTILP